jgi:hypothetical protein
LATERLENVLSENSQRDVPSWRQPVEMPGNCIADIFFEDVRFIAKVGGQIGQETREKVPHVEDAGCRIPKLGRGRLVV